MTQSQALTHRLSLALSCALLIAACDDPTENIDDLFDPCAPKTETSTYTYDAQGQFSKIERRMMDGLLHTKTFTAGRITSYTYGSPDASNLDRLPIISAAWTYDDQSRISTISVDDRSTEGALSTWSLTFSYDTHGNLSRLTGQGPITGALAQQLGSNESEEALFLGVGASLIDGLDLKQAEAFPLTPFINTVVNYTYDANNQFLESTWDYNGDGTIDATRRDRFETNPDTAITSHISDLYYDTAASVVAYTITRQPNPDGTLAVLTSQILVSLDNFGRWTTNPLQNPITSTKTWTRATPTNAPAGHYEIRESLSLLGSASYISRIRRYDEQDRILSDLHFNESHALTDQTRVTYANQDRTELRDRDVDNFIDQRSTYRYDPSDGRVLTITIDETADTCEPGFGPWE